MYCSSNVNFSTGVCKKGMSSSFPLSMMVATPSMELMSVTGDKLFCPFETMISQIAQLRKVPDFRGSTPARRYDATLIHS